MSARGAGSPGPSWLQTRPHALPGTSPLRQPGWAGPGGAEPEEAGPGAPTDVRSDQWERAAAGRRRDFRRGRGRLAAGGSSEARGAKAEAAAAAAAARAGPGRSGESVGEAAAGLGASCRRPPPLFRPPSVRPSVRHDAGHRQAAHRGDARGQPAGEGSGRAGAEAAARSNRSSLSRALGRARGGRSARPAPSGVAPRTRMSRDGREVARGSRMWRGGPGCRARVPEALRGSRRSRRGPGCLAPWGGSSARRRGGLPGPGVRGTPEKPLGERVGRERKRSDQ